MGVQVIMLCSLFLAVAYVTCCLAETNKLRRVGAPRPDDAPLGQLLADLARASRRQRGRAPRCLLLLADPHHAAPLVTPRLSRTSPLLVARVPEGDLASRQNVSAALEALRVARYHDCSLVAIFLRNGRQLVKLLRKADRLRLLHSRTHLVLPMDKRLFAPTLLQLWRRLVNVVFVLDTPRGLTRCFQLSTVTFPVPADLDHPETWLPITLDQWCNGRFKIRYPIFIDKTLNLKNQPMRVAFYKHMPSAVEVPSEIEPALPGVTALHGVEIELIALLSRGLRFHPLLLEVANRSEGVADAVAEGHADLGLASLPHVPHFLQRLDLSQPYAAHCLTFLTPEALGDLSWYTLLLPFTPDLWRVSVAVLVIAWLALHAVARLQVQRSRFSNVLPSLFHAWGMQLLVSVSSPPRGWPLRLLFGCVWVHCLLLAVAYRASFAAQLARPPPRFAVDSLDQLAASKHLTPLTWALYARYVCRVLRLQGLCRELLESSQEASSQAVGARLRATEAPALEVAAQVAAGTAAFLENEHQLRHIRQAWQKHVAITPDAGGFRLHVMQECVATLPVSLGLAPNSALTGRVGALLRRAAEVGLTTKWLRDATAGSRRDSDLEATHRQQALVSLPKMVGALLALAVGYLLGAMALIAELLHFRYRHRH